MRITLSDAATLFHDDCRNALKALPDNSVDSCCTDPPYALGFMGKKWDVGDVAFHVDFWAEVYRVLKPGAFVAAFGASRGYHRMACAIEDAGFEIRDSLMWMYGTGFPKSHDVSKGIDRELGAVRIVTREGAVKRDGYGDDWDTGPSTDRPRKDLPATPQAAEWEGWGTALKPAFEPIVLARKPLSEPTVAANVLRWRTGALNIDASRIHTEGSEARAYTVKRLKPGATLVAEGGNWRPEGDDVAKYEGVTKDGRWPANVVTDGSDEVVGMFPSAGGQLAPISTRHRFFYSAKASKADRAGSKHPTVKPISLMGWLATLITPPGGTILDPFAGSGTTGIAAVRKGFHVILCEREAEYVADIRARFGTPHLSWSEAVRAELALAAPLAALR